MTRRDEMSNSKAIALFIQRSQVRKGHYDEIVRFFEVPYIYDKQKRLRIAEPFKLSSDV